MPKSADLSNPASRREALRMVDAVRHIQDLRKAAEHQAAAAHLPTERPYPLPDELRDRIGATRGTG